MSSKQPVMSVDRVEARWVGRVLQVHAVGSTATLGWSGGELEPVGRRSDVLELSLVARPPPGMAAQAIGEVEASRTVSDAEGLRTVRVVSAGNQRDARVPKP